MIKNQTTLQRENSYSPLVWIKLLGCSLFGVGFFLVPFVYDGSWTISLGVVSNLFSGLIGENMKYFTCSIFILGALISIIYNLPPRSFAEKLPLSEKFIASHWFWTLLAVIGGVTSAMTLFQFGPEWVFAKETGVTAYIDVAGAIFLLIGLGCLFLPFLTDYGLLDFIGTLLQKGFQKFFNLPGRATIDTLASWVGSSSIAVVMTNYQYMQGYYSARESAVIATNFSVVSIPFVLLTAQVAGIESHFLQLYATMIFICVLCAIVTPKLPPLSSFKDEYYGGNGKQLNEDVNHGESRFLWASHRALATAKKAPSPGKSIKKGFWSMLDIYLMMMPAAMTIEFLTLSVYYNTGILQTLSYPFYLLLEALQIPEAEMAAPGIFIGLLDQFVPTIIAGDIESPITKFILAGLSITQLIFFAETAILIMRSAIPLTIMQLIAIFIVRTIIAFPILVCVAHMLF
ncbi:nucleoside recognition domain-containing protein [Aliiglaciecola sp. 3_MG-2023]|uniref:YjiH family protein n=1 Tax=Aliiglaciecola sp. 3_MG-2023 TaxID=3062644 RepID=UPI0026E34FCA|nr:nucleoside recognition domain-containing protein [Aliiglaciecola sp. 3_MG-2023]MDO6694504.1 nucleoside recognition domain-containing protein [Aliiglaciecola sp. 3_MG-2023]